MFLPQLRRSTRQHLLLAILAGILEEDILVMLGDPSLDDDVVGVALQARRKLVSIAWRS